MSLICPLDAESNPEFVTSVKIKDLVSLYNRRAGLDIRPIFNELSELGFYHCPSCDLRFFYPLISGPAFFYEELQKKQWYFEKEREEFFWAKNWINNSSSVLEIGAGEGNFARMISTSQYHGLEFTRKAIELANKSGTEIFDQSIENHSIQNHEKYDVVCAFQVLEHISSVHSFINSGLKCLKPGGYLLLSVPSADSFLPSCVNLYENMPPHHVTWWSDRSLISIGRVFGLIVEDIYHEDLASYHRRWYLSTAIAASLRGGDEILKPRIDLSLGHFIGQMFLQLFAIPVSWLLNDPHVLSKGHSVMVAYRKS